MFLVPSHDLWSHEVARTQRHCQTDWLVRCCTWLVRFDPSHEPEIGQLDPWALEIGIQNRDQHVVRLDISVNDVVFVQGTQSHNQLFNDVADLMDTEARLLEHQLPDSAKLAILEDHVLILTTLEHLEHFNKLRVIDLLREVDVRRVQRFDQLRASLKLAQMHLLDAHACPRFPILCLVNLVMLCALHCLYQPRKLVL